MLTAPQTGSVLASRLVGPANPSALLLFGAGLQVYHHARLILLDNPSIQQCTIINRSSNERLAHVTRKLASEFASRDVHFTSGDPSRLDVKSCVQVADIICTATPSMAPLFESGWVKRGTHINLIGSYKPNMREIGEELVRRAGTVIVDSREPCLVEAGELIAAGLTREDIIEIGELCTEEGHPDVERCEAVRNSGEVTIFKSVGVGVQDVAIAATVLERARSMGVGTSLGYSNFSAA